ncbi:MAG: L,D-transpeptidase family protein [Endomicrobia bacterium]|nr:L,D-transpeptidase family protein [Endomicrobiia bacterium]
MIVKLSSLAKYNSKQYILVLTTTTTTFTAKLYTYEVKRKNHIVSVFPVMDAVVGRNGVAQLNEKFEGDGKTPSGVYRLGAVFYQTATLKTKLQKIKTQDDDFWIDDVNSDFYNCWIRGKLPEGVKSYEKMNIPLYKYCVVIQYNTNPVVKGKGSAIFLHLWKSKTLPTAGCVAVSEEDMLKLLKWLDKRKNPLIIISTTELLDKIIAIQ